ncbi:MAG: cytochrome c maturation protein CcmE [Ignavibacteria bacterium]|jgi:cytochrome c-type biogenesis protein CcmE
MKTRYWVGLIMSLAFLVLGISVLDSSKIAYGTIEAARETGKKMQVKGTWVRDKGSNYDAGRNLFTFTMKDEKGEEIQVEYQGARPNNFDIAESIVVKGLFEDQQFIAYEILTKCPSKYEGNAEQLRKSGI